MNMKPHVRRHEQCGQAKRWREEKKTSVTPVAIRSACLLSETGWMTVCVCFCSHVCMQGASSRRTPTTIKSEMIAARWWFLADIFFLWFCACYAQYRILVVFVFYCTLYSISQPIDPVCGDISITVRLYVCVCFMLVLVLLFCYGTRKLRPCMSLILALHTETSSHAYVHMGPQKTMAFLCYRALMCTQWLVA